MEGGVEVDGNKGMETNRYAAQAMAHNLYVTPQEIRVYIGFCILMSIVRRLPALREYWTKDKLLNYAPISQRISQKNFFF